MASASLPQITESVYEFYRNRPVIVTGASGFLGKHVVKLLDSLKAEIFPITSSDVDLREDRHTVSYFMDNFVHDSDLSPSDTILIHLAANVSGIHDTSATPLDHLEDNVRMAISVMKAVHAMRFRNVVFAGSVCAYPERTPCPMVEKNLWEGRPEPTNFSYGESKRFTQSLIDAYHQQRFIDNYAFLISANLYGPGDHFEPEISHVIPAMITKIDYAKEVSGQVNVWGTGRASRDFLYVEDAAKAYVMAGYHVMQSREPIVVNIGSGHEVTIAGLVSMLASIMSFRGSIVYDDTKPDGQMRRLVSIYQAIDKLGWRPTTELEVGLGRTLQWYDQYVKPYNQKKFQYYA